MERAVPSLDEIFSPRGVAVVGVSPADKYSFLFRVVESLQEVGYPAIFPVNPKYQEIRGLPCYPSVSAIPFPVDYAVVAIPATAVLALLDDCAAKKVKAVQFFTAGFSESRQQARVDLEKEMLVRARRGGFRIIGPNCIGLFVPKSRLTYGLGLPFEPGRVAFISQSGGHAHDLPFCAGPRGIRFSKVVSYGNGLDISESELLEYLARDEDTDIISAYIEGIKDGPRFWKALKAVASRKPVIIYKGGTTEAGLRTAHGHTASLTSSTSVFAAACRQANSITADDIEDIIDLLVALRFVKPAPAGPGAAVIGTGGGPSVLASDWMERAGLRFPKLSPEVDKKLRQLLPLAGTIFDNPVDSISLLRPDVIADTARLLLNVPDIHMLVYHLGFHPVSYWEDGQFSAPEFLGPLIKHFLEIKRVTGKPVLIALRSPPDMRGMDRFLSTRDRFIKAEFPVFHSLRQLAYAMARIVAWKPV